MVEFIICALWTTRGHESGDLKPILIDNQSLQKAREGLAERLQVLLSRAETAWKGSTSYVQNEEPETAHQGSFLGPMVSNQYRDDVQPLGSESL